MFYGRDYGEKVPLSNRTEALIRPEIEQGGQRSYPAQVAQRRSHIETRVRPHHGHDRHLCEHERERGSGTRCVRYCTSSIFSDIFHRCISPGLKLGKYNRQRRLLGNFSVDSRKLFNPSGNASNEAGPPWCIRRCATKPSRRAGALGISICVASRSTSWVRFACENTACEHRGDNDVDRYSL